MHLRLWEVRSVVPERVLSVESDSETLGRTGRRRQKTDSSREVGSVVAEYRVSYCTPAHAYTLCYGKTERCARTSALARAVATARGSSMM
jgi:hypothetical protein